jgi:hypothetical protein
MRLTSASYFTVRPVLRGKRMNQPQLKLKCSYHLFVIGGFDGSVNSFGLLQVVSGVSVVAIGVTLVTAAWLDSDHAFGVRLIRLK